MRTLRVTVAFNATNRLKFATLLSAASSPLNAAEMSSVICGQAKCDAVVRYFHRIDRTKSPLARLPLGSRMQPTISPHRTTRLAF